ncbi:fimbrial protein [Pectobacterium odoriferum]|uniref:fimbrial protein n=1 Tax=Pectobacterium odoriferum TaxID=78398 RepID=UPI0032EAC20B
MIKHSNTVAKTRSRGPLLTFTLGLIALHSGASFAQQMTVLDDREVTFRVLVVNAACNVSTESKAIVVDMSEVSDRYLKANRYGDWHDFTINLTDCNLDTYQNVTIRFSGKEEPLLPKRLAFIMLTNWSASTAARTVLCCKAETTPFSFQPASKRYATT